MGNILTDEEAKIKYQNKVFTEAGWETLYNYTRFLILEFLVRKDQIYFDGKLEEPFQFSAVFGVPFFSWAHQIKTIHELKGRIKSNMQMLGIEEFKVEKGTEIIVFSFRGD